MALEVMAGLLAVLVLLNAWTTRVVFRDELASHGQRTAQIAFVWLIPFLGALLTLHMKRNEAERSLGRYREPPDPGDDFGFSGRRHRNTDKSAASESEGSGDGGSSE